MTSGEPLMAATLDAKGRLPHLGNNQTQSSPTLQSACAKSATAIFAQSGISGGINSTNQKKGTAMKKLIVATATIAALATPALAADMAPRYTKAPMIAPVMLYDWSGFYVGINGGGGSSRNCWDLVAVLGPFPLGSDGCHDATGGTVGGQVGYRWQNSSWVFGLEAQGNWANFRGDNLSFLPAVRNQTELDSFGLFTGQIGYAWNSALLYVKGGAAVVHNKYTGFDVPTGLVGDSATATNWGGVVGVGMEYGFTPNWSFAIEYDHMFMGDHDANMVTSGNLGPAGIIDRTDRIRQDVDLFTARVNYRFGGPVVAKY